MPKIVDRDEMQRTILDGALQAFAARGYHASTIADVAEAAGLGKGTLYLYFKNKDAIVEALVDRHFAAMGDQFRGEPKPDTLEDFVESLSRAMDVPETHAQIVRVFFEVFGPRFASDSFAGKVAGFFDGLGAHYAQGLAALQAKGAIRPDIDPDAAGRMLASLIDGMVLHEGLFAIPKARNKMLQREAVALFLNGLRAG